MINKNTFLTTFLTVTTLLPSCKSTCDCNSVNRQSKDGETLFKICRYVVENDIVIKPADPCSLEITGIKRDTLNGTEVARLKLSCCYMGDEAIIDKKTNEVIGYLASDK